MQVKIHRGFLSVAALGCVLLAGCAAKKPVSYRFSGCVVQKTWTDDQGRERKECECPNGKQVGWDAKTDARVIQCRPRAKITPVDPVR